MEAKRFSETSVDNKPTRRHIPEDDLLYIHFAGCTVIINKPLNYNGAQFNITESFDSLFCMAMNTASQRKKLRSELGGTVWAQVDGTALHCTRR
jgi:hypothetical protein